MSLLTPLGLLGLLGIGILILIYLIKPNYQQKFVSTTYIWRLSLNYKKKRIPINRLRNVLLFLCQLLVITVSAFILAQPFVAAAMSEEHPERILILDASAGMNTTSGGETRFERAVTEAMADASETFDQNGVVTVILASNEPVVLAQQIGANGRAEALAALDNAVCTYGAADIEGALSMAEPILQNNPNAEILFYTDTSYTNSGIVQVVNVAADEEWNVAILDCTPVFDENSYTFEIDVASYDRPADLTLQIDVVGANDYENNGQGTDISMLVPVRCDVDSAGNAVVSTVKVYSADYGQPVISSYDYIYVSVLDVNDSLEEDNIFYVYGGKTDSLKVQIWSSDPNNFFYRALSILQDRLRTVRDIEFVQVGETEGPAVEGFDIYIFEHELPQSVLTNGLPQDGVVVFSDPDRAVVGMDITMGETVRLPELQALSKGADHPITSYMQPERFGVTEYKRVSGAVGYEALLYCGDDPLLLVKNEVDRKMVVMPFSVNMSTFPNSWDFMILLYNMIDYYFPLTTTEYVFDVNQPVSLQAKGASLTVNGPTGPVAELDSFPGEVTFTQAGTYTLTQLPISGIEETDLIYVRMPAEESDIFSEADVLTHMQVEQVQKYENYDLLLYFAIAVVTLLLAEWWLQSRENF